MILLSEHVREARKKLYMIIVLFLLINIVVLCVYPNSDVESGSSFTYENYKYKGVNVEIDLSTNVAFNEIKKVIDLLDDSHLESIRNVTLYVHRDKNTLYKNHFSNYKKYLKDNSFTLDDYNLMLAAENFYAFSSMTRNDGEIHILLFNIDEDNVTEKISFSILHEIRHFWQYNQGNDIYENVSNVSHDQYNKLPREVDANTFAENLLGKSQDNIWKEH